MKTYTPTKGRCVIGFREEFTPLDGGIVTPDMVSDRRSVIGKVVSITPEPKRLCYPMVGDTVIVPMHTAGTKIGNGQEIMRIDDIAAVIEGDASELKSGEDSILRCRFCGPAKPEISSNGVMLEEQGPNGILSCPRCKRDVNGNIPDDTPVISDDEVEQYRRMKAAGQA